MEKPAVLLLERTATVIEVAQRCLADEVELHVANTLDLALRIAARRQLVVAVLDATMAGAAPGETVAKLRAQRPGLRIVFLAEPAFDIDRRYAQLGSVIRKPITPERLTDAVRNALRLQSMSAGVQRMRTSSGTFPAVTVAETPPVGITTARSSPPPSGLVPVTSEAAAPAEAETGEANRESATADKAPNSRPGETRRVTPPPFARVR
jgi:CheY-like chemotaxis protein